MRKPDLNSRATRTGAGRSISHQRGQFVDDIADLKNVMSFRSVVEERGLINREGKTLCPFHDDHRPSLHVYPDGFHCFTCGAHGDIFDWLMAVYGLDFADALEEVRRRVGDAVVPRVRRPRKPPVPVAKGCKARPVPADAVAAHLRRAARLDRLPLALQGRGFSLDDARQLHLARERDDLLFTVPGPDGTILALKRRWARPRGKRRYRYEISGHGAPAWCSPKMLEHHDLLVIEGELNGMACHLARPDIGVMGTAGAEGGLHLEALGGRTIYVYADGDEPGGRARQRWARAAHGAGAARVYTLEPWEADACDIAGKLGRDALRERLRWGAPPKYHGPKPPRIIRIIRNPTGPPPPGLRRFTA